MVQPTETMKPYERLSTLNDRKDRMIEFNSTIRNRYFPNDWLIERKLTQYWKVLQAIKNEIISIEATMYKEHLNSPEHAKLIATSGKSGFEILIEK